jgi:hypothetical protein
MCTKFLLGNLKGRAHLEDIGKDGRIILKYILDKLCGRVWTGFIWFRIRTSVGLL